MYLKRENKLMQNLSCFVITLTLNDSPLIKEVFTPYKYSESYIFYCKKEAKEYHDRIRSLRFQATDLYLQKLVKYYISVNKDAVTHMGDLYYIYARKSFIEYSRRAFSKYYYKVCVDDPEILKSSTVNIILNRLDFLSRLNINFHVPILKNDESVLNAFLNYMEKK